MTPIEGHCEDWGVASGIRFAPASGPAVEYSGSPIAQRFLLVIEIFIYFDFGGWGVLFL